MEEYGLVLQKMTSAWFKDHFKGRRDIPNEIVVKDEAFGIGKMWLEGVREVLEGEMETGVE